MAQITQNERTKRIRDLLKEFNGQPPEKHETYPIQIRGNEPILCDVIRISADELLLNHASHRIRSQVEDDPEWQAERNDPHSESSQRIIERYVRNSRSEQSFAELKESLLHEGQSEPGVITHEGVLVNANTRAVAMREFPDPSKRYLRVAVLPEFVARDELSLLELRLQMQKELKEDYSLTNKLLFIRELAVDRGLPNEQIAKELRLEPGNPKKGASAVDVRLRGLEIIELMRNIPENRPRLAFFDALSEEHLASLVREYDRLVEGDPHAATEFLRSYLLAAIVGVTQVRKIREVDVDFMREYMFPQLEDDEQVGPYARAIASPSPEEAEEDADLGLLLTGDNDGDESPVSTQSLIEAVTDKNGRILVNGSSITLSRTDVKDALRSAISRGLDEKRGDRRAENKLDAPSDAIKSASTSLAKAVDAFKRVENDPEFDQSRRKSLEAAFKKLRRAQRNLEQTLVAAEIVDKS